MLGIVQRWQEINQENLNNYMNDFKNQKYTTDEDLARLQGYIDAHGAIESELLLLIAAMQQNPQDVVLHLGNVIQQLDGQATLLGFLVVLEEKIYQQNKYAHLRFQTAKNTIDAFKKIYHDRTIKIFTEQTETSKLIFGRDY